jgi:mono/diheme cytochrome c family protein
MQQAVKLTATAAILALGMFAPRSASAQAEAVTKASDFVVDEAMAKQGKSLFTSRSCTGCHTIGKGKMAGPDLANVLDRRSLEWVQSWLKDPPAMMETDETAKALVKEYNNMKMPNMKLTDAEALALIHHITKESQKVKKK